MTDFSFLDAPDPARYSDMLWDESDDEYREALGVDDHRELPSQKARIHDGDWDLLCVFDACRWDAMRAAFPDETVDAVVSEGHQTPVWLPNTWTEEYPELTYVSGHPFTEPENEALEDTKYDVPDLSERMGKLVQTSTMRGENAPWDTLLGTSRPKELAAIASDESFPMVIHFLQPHTPFIGDVMLNCKHGVDHVDIKAETEKPGRFYPLVEAGHINIDLVRLAYFTNLIEALSGIDDLLRQVRNERYSRTIPGDQLSVVFTADHGEIVNEDLCTHGGPSLPQTMAVPWMEFQI